MINKRLIGTVKESKKYIAANVVLQWLSLAANIAMMAAIAVTRCEQPVTLLGAECVNKSYPSFWEDYQHLGGNIQIIDD